MEKTSRKVAILHAAARVVKEHGIFNLTMEAAAKEAGISKGGLLYHYPSKEALVKGMVEHLAENYTGKIRDNAQNEKGNVGNWTRAFLHVTFNQTYQYKEMNAGLLAAKAVKPELLLPIKDAYTEWQQNIENDDIDPITATIIRLAADGIWLSELFGVNQLEDEKREQILQRLDSWTKNKRNDCSDKHSL